MLLLGLEGLVVERVEVAAWWAVGVGIWLGEVVWWVEEGWVVEEWVVEECLEVL